MIRITFTIDIEEEHLTSFEDNLAKHFNLVSSKILPDTSELYKNDKGFKKLVKKVKDAKLELENYRLSKL